MRKLRAYKKTVSIVEETTVGLYKSLVGNKIGFLLESYDKNNGRYSIFAPPIFKNAFWKGPRFFAREVVKQMIRQIIIWYHITFILLPYLLYVKKKITTYRSFTSFFDKKYHCFIDFIAQKIYNVLCKFILRRIFQWKKYLSLHFS